MLDDMLQAACITTALLPFPKKDAINERVYGELLKQILYRELVPGETIDRLAVAGRLGVSVAPVSQALTRLASEGLVEMVARKHTRVRLVRYEDVRGQFYLRMAIERQVVAVAKAEDFRRHEQTLKELAREVDRWPAKDPSAWPAELMFHQAMVDVADCETLSDAYRRVMRRNYFFALHTAHVQPRRDAQPNQHTTLVDRLCLDDQEAREIAIMSHFAADFEAFKSIAASRGVLHAREEGS